MLIFRRILAVIVSTLPIDIIIVGCAIKGLSLEDSGLVLLGTMTLLVGGLYVWFGAPKEKKVPLGTMVLGLVVSITATIALILGLAITVAPICYLGMNKLWKNEKKPV